MANELLVFQYGGPDLSGQLRLPDGMTWKRCAENETTIKEKSADVLVIGSRPDAAVLDALAGLAAAHNVFSLVPAEEEKTPWKIFQKRKMVQYLPAITQEWVDALPLRYWRGQYGERAKMEELAISRDFHGEIHFHGHDRIFLNGAFGVDYEPLVEWRFHYMLEKDRDRDLWLEYSADRGVVLRLCVRLSLEGSSRDVIKTLYFDLEPDSADQEAAGRAAGGLSGNNLPEDEEKAGDQNTELHIPSFGVRCYMNFSLEVKGTGELRLGTLHVRNSRQGFGTFLAGGRRFADRNRREFCSYFDPMDLKPPLNVYYSGYRTAEGFEGYYMMRNLGAPFLLFTDPRLEGGCFYLGSEEYENAILETIRSAMSYLGFGRDDLIMSGISMGTSGALYYGVQLRPHAIILGKPLINLGDIADNEKKIRPGGFPTSLDVMLTQTGEASSERIEAMNRRMWDKIDSANLKNVRIAISYMQQDDYDMTAYEDLLNHLEKKDVRIYGKGLLGRHNDNTKGVLEWLLSRYRNIMRTDFKRDI